MNNLPQQPPQNRSNNSVLITIIICATVIVLFVLGFLLVNALSDKKEDTVKENVETVDVAKADTAYKKVKTLDVPEGNVKPAKKKTGSLANVGFTDDYSDIVCYSYLSDSDLRYLSKSQLRILRNTIYARHGRKFKSKDLRDYFAGFSWYTPLYEEIAPGSLSDIEQYNIKLIQSYE